MSAVIVERKTMVPFAAAAILATIIALLTKFNSLWFVVDIPSETATWLSAIMMVIGVACAIPAITRALFVNVSITWDGRPRKFVVRFVPAHRGKRLARRFQKLSERV